ncbi:MAG: YdeI/OmpD-associated family protein [Candidatus Dojkabacteria bacterium]
MKFTAKIFTGGGQTAGFLIPEDVMTSLGDKKRVPVVITLNGYSYRSTVATYEGKQAVGISIENREKAGVKIGDTLEIDVSFDDKPRIVEVPEIMQKELEKNPKAKEVFEGLAFTHKKEYVKWIEEAKKEETKTSRLEKLNQMILDKHKAKDNE